MVILPSSFFLWNSTTSSLTRRTIFGLDLDRGSNDGDKYFQGLNIQNSTFSVRAEWNTGPTEPITIYSYIRHDCGFIISDGVCIASR
jgi:hypothetical protein